LYRQGRNPVRQLHERHSGGLLQPAGDRPGAEAFPYVATTYRLTEHHTAGGMSRWLPYLVELQPEPFCEVSPELAAERGLAHRGWATIVTARAAIEARVLVTERMPVLRLAGGRRLHHVGLPYHWGPNGLSTGDAANELSHLVLDPNVHIQEVKAFACDIRPGRRPRGPALRDLVAGYRRRAGITERTGKED
jgi:formate dehydrogenase major subunit